MSSLARALTVRFFGTQRLAATSVLRLAGFVLAVVTLPYVVFWVGTFLYLLFVYSLLLGGYGLVTVIIPLLVLLADSVALFLLYLLARGYVKLMLYFFKWMAQQYALAQSDRYLNRLFSEDDAEGTLV